MVVRDNASRTEAGASHLLTVNGGSSSLKFALFARGGAPTRVASGKIERIGLPETRLIASGAAGGRREERPVRAADLGEAVGPMIDWLRGLVGLDEVAAIGHRIVHGGALHRPERITPGLLDALREVAPLDPDHVPGELALIDAIAAHAPGVPQVACFDTAFHHDLPRVARIVPIPRRYEARGVRRFGFHGLSYAYLNEELARRSGGNPPGRAILAHLGSGASLAAVRDGRCIDTTMGFTPTSGLVMGTRPGDLDPGLPGFLARSEGMTAAAFHHMVNRESGLLGVSETSSDIRDLLAREATDVRAAEAVDLFCYRVRTQVGALAAALGGLDALVFAGGIGEHSHEVRRRALSGLEFLGITLDEGRNLADAPLISRDDGPVAVHVIPTDEEMMIARATDAVIG
ncbi:acetate/propionate family kinase [Tundrisphaera sp. TA3]|uniref:acetate/propionate family kinase n=1 Tax=Tundrisphaera sp. TA3 TaxID=3435775 RepID=UPI003EC09606